VGALEYFNQVDTRNAGSIDGTLEYLGRVGTRKMRNRGCARIKRGNYNIT
jgi:hypothetical protein